MSVYGKTDISGLKDTIVGFVNDYNKIIGNDENTLWCVDRNTVRETFDNYKENILKKLNEQELMINTL